MSGFSGVGPFPIEIGTYWSRRREGGRRIGVRVDQNSY